jgi:hypothetical protein
VKSVKRKKLQLHFDEIEKWARKNPVITVLAICIIVASSIVTLTDGFSRLKEMYANTFGDNSTIYAKIQMLGASTTIDYFSSILGAPAFREKVGTNYFEYIYVNPKYYVQAVADSGNNILLYSVTTRDPQFNPVIKVGGRENDRPELSLVLGKTKFSELPFKPIRLDADQPADESGYYDEKYYFGKPGAYLNYDFASAASGYPVCDQDVPFELILRLPASETLRGVDVNTLPVEVRKFRAGCIINTFSASFLSTDLTNDIDCQIEIGADTDLVNALH